MAQDKILSNSERAELLRLRAFKSHFDNVSKADVSKNGHTVEDIYDMAMLKYTSACATVRFDLNFLKRSELMNSKEPLSTEDKTRIVHNLARARALSEGIYGLTVAGWIKTIEDSLSYEEKVGFEFDVIDALNEAMTEDKILETKVMVSKENNNKGFVLVTYDIDLQVIMDTCKRNVIDRFRNHNDKDKFDMDLQE